jgi:hypothetical protein
MFQSWVVRFWWKINYNLLLTPPPHENPLMWISALSLVLLHAWKGQFWCLQVEISCCGQSVNPVQPVRNLVERWLRVGPARPLQTVIGSSGGDYVMVISYGRPRQSWMYHCHGDDTRSCCPCEEVIGDKRHSLSCWRIIKQCGWLFHKKKQCRWLLCNLQPALLYHILVLIDTVRWCSSLWICFVLSLFPYRWAEIDER